MNKVIIFLSILFQLSSCSFHSSQYDLFKSILVQEDNDSLLKPEKNWTAYWFNQKIDLYAINFEDQIIFADENINILFKDEQVYKIIGLFPEDSVLEVDSNGQNLSYFLNGKKIGVDYCEVGQSTAINDMSRKYSRSCIGSKSKKIYENKIIINSEGMIVSMQFKVHPDYPLLKLSMK